MSTDTPHPDSDLQGAVDAYLAVSRGGAELFGGDQDAYEAAEEAAWERMLAAALEPVR
jgi:hypothetical protein